MHTGLYSVDVSRSGNVGQESCFTQCGAETMARLGSVRDTLSLAEPLQSSSLPWLLI